MSRRYCVQEVLCLGGIVSRRYCVQDVLCLGGIVSRRYCVQEVLCLGGIVSRRYCVQEVLCLGGIVKLLKQGFLYHKLRKTFAKFYNRHFDLVELFLDKID